MLTTYSLLGMSLWSGGLRYACDPYSNIVVQNHLESTFSSSSSSGSWTGNLTAVANDLPMSREKGLRSWWTYEYLYKTEMLPPLEFRDCPACLECAETQGKCAAYVQPVYIRSEDFGFSGFDNFAQSMLTMFVQMTGDNGMQDIPFALVNAKVSLSGAGWLVMATATAVLTTLALNLFLAVCCSVFDGVMDKIESRRAAAIERAKKREAAGFGSDTGNTDGLFGVVSDVKVKLIDPLLDKVIKRSEEAIEAKKPNDVKYLDYEEKVAALNWHATGSRIAGCRTMCKRIVLAPWFSIMINLLILVNALILCSNHHGMAQAWKDTNVLIESCCLIIFWFEFIAKLFAFGPSLYFSETTNRLDTAVLVATSTGVMGTMMETMAAEMNDDNVQSVSAGFSAFNSIRIVKMMRALQMSRWIFGHPALRQILQTVFKSWQSIILIGAFSAFSMLMFSTGALQILGWAGACLVLCFLPLLCLLVIIPLLLEFSCRWEVECESQRCPFSLQWR